MLLQHEADQENGRLRSRMAVRFPNRGTDPGSLSQEEMRILRMSNTEYARFRSSSGEEPAAPEGMPQAHPESEAQGATKVAPTSS